ncbi:MAG TPA: META domain-containing protein [Burkholderiales bacterium]
MTAARALLVVLIAAGCAQAPSRPAGEGLVGPVWQLVRFTGGDDRVLTPVDRRSYTLQFGADGRVSARIDCNRGSGTYKTTGTSGLEFGQMAITRAMCPPGSMHDHVVRQLPHIKSFVIKDGRLYLSLMADGGTYEFEPAR